MIIATLLFSLATIALFAVGAYASSIVIKRLLQEDSLETTDKLVRSPFEGSRAARESSVIRETYDVVTELHKMLEQVLLFQQQDYFQKRNYVYGFIEHSKEYSDNLSQKKSLLIEQAN